MSQKGLSIAGLQYFDSWTSVGSLRRRKRLKKGLDLCGQLWECNLTVFSKAEGLGEKGKALFAMLRLVEFLHWV